MTTDRFSSLPPANIFSASFLTVAFFALCPIVVFFANPDVFGNRVADIDTWFYFGHFTRLGEYRNVEALIGNNYYQTRLPYLIPGYVIFSVFSEPWAKFILGYVSYAVTTASFYYLVSANFDRQKAALVTALFATDVFFVRGYGWNYVDIGVIAYFTMGMAAITWAGQSDSWRLAKMALAGFAFACMLFVHFGAVILAVPALAYLWYLMPQARTQRGITFLFGGLLLGAIAAQLVFGVLNKAIWGSRFFFLLEQLAVGRIELRTNPSWESPFALLKNGPWVTVHFGVWLATVAALIMAAVGRIRFELRDVVWLSSVVLLYAALFAVDAAGWSNFTMREGLRMTFFLTSTYFCVPFLLGAISSRAAVRVVILLSLTALAANIWILPNEHLIDGRILAIVIALALGIGCYFGRTGVTAATLVVVIAARFFVSWPFAQNETIYQAHALIHSLSDGDLPQFITSENDPLYGSILACIISTFTERAWWLHGMKYPELPARAAWNKSKVFVLSSTLNDPADALKELAPKVDKLKLVGSFQLGKDSKAFTVVQFEASNRISTLPQFSKYKSKEVMIPAAMLPSTFGPETVIGDGRKIENQASAGYLTFGPYVAIARGKYRVVIKHGKVSGDQGWDVVAPVSGEGFRVLAAGLFPATDKDGQETSAEIDVPSEFLNVEIRTRFSGQGALSVDAVGIVPLE